MPSVTIQEAFALALRHHQGGRLAEAEALYRQIIAGQANHAGAWHHLGVIAHQMGRDAMAVEWIRHALVLDANNPAAHSNLGEVYHSTGRLDEAIACFRRALELQPNHPEAHYNLGNALSERGESEEAIAAFGRALQGKPDYAEAHHNLGNALAGRGRFDEAIAAYRRALELLPGRPGMHNNLGIALKERNRMAEAIAEYRQALQLQPDYASARYNLGNALRETGDLDGAIDEYRRALALQPDLAEAHNNLGLALSQRGQGDEAIAAYRQAIERQPELAEAQHNLGNVFRDRGRLDEAMAFYRRALEINPGFKGACNNLGNALRDDGQLDEAIAMYRRALELDPEFAEAHNNLGTALAGRGELEEAMAAYRRAIELQPEDPLAWSNLLYALHFHLRSDSQMIAGELRRWNRQFAAPLRKLHRPHGNDRDPERRLRIGYVSPNFNRHPICYFFIPLLEAHDRARVEIYCYSGILRPDQYTERVKRSADVWRDVSRFADDSLVERIRTDQIDILVDLTQHMANNRLLTFARKPAPVQMAWLGYPASTGLPAMDYRLTDRFLEPDGAVWSQSVEKPVHLPDAWFCYDPIEDREVAALPAVRTGHVTFGSLNNFGKFNEPVFRLWVAVLQAVEGSRLMLHCPAGATQTRLRQWFEGQGIATHRLELVPWAATRAEFLDLFQRIDIGLDPFPYNGGTTTCDALWMGVPVVSLAGQAAVSRLGLSILSNAGLPEWAATAEDEYVEIARRLAHDLPRLAELRAGLRARLRASPLMDAPRFARHIESVYRTLWRGWCAGEP